MKKSSFFAWFVVAVFVIFIGGVMHHNSSMKKHQTIAPAHAFDSGRADNGNSVENAPSMKADGDGVIVKEGKATVRFTTPSPTNRGFIPESEVKALQRSSN